MDRDRVNAGSFGRLMVDKRNGSSGAYLSGYRIRACAPYSSFRLSPGRRQESGQDPSNGGQTVCLFLHVLEELSSGSCHDFYGLFPPAFKVAEIVSGNPLFSHRNRVDAFKHSVFKAYEKINKRQGYRLLIR